MAHEKVIHNGLILEATLSEDATNRILSYNSTTGLVTYRNAIDETDFASSTLPDGQIYVGNVSGVATAVVVSGVIAITNAGVTSIVDGSIVNADVNASAAIVYSKLSLTDSIVNADVNSAAAIAYSKLNLSTSIVNADIAVAAAIARSKIAVGTAYRFVTNSATGALQDTAVTASRAVVTDANGLPAASATTATQIGYLSTSTSDIQAQLDGLIAGVPVNAIIQSPTIAEDGFAITWDNTAGEYTLIDPVTQGIPAAGTTRQFLGKVSSTDYDTDWLDLLVSDISDLTSTVDDLNLLAGAQAAGLTSGELQYLIGTTDTIQTQFDAKQSSSLAHNAIWVGNASGIAAQLSAGTDSYVLTSVGGAPQWQPDASSTLNPWLLASGGTLTGNNTITMGTYSLTYTQGVSTSGSPTGWTFTGGAHTTLAQAEVIDLNFNLNRTVQFANAAGGHTTQRAILIQAPTYSHAAGSTRTIATASTLSISGAPTAGSNTTITNSQALRVEGGRVSFELSNGSTTVGGVTIVDGVSSNKILLDLKKASSVFAVTQEGRVTIAAPAAIQLDANDTSAYLKITADISANSGFAGSASELLLTGTVTAEADTHTLYGIRNTSTFAASTFTPVVVGFQYTPTITGSPSVHYASRWDSGLHFIKNHGTTVPAVPTDGFIHYSADIVAGNAAPHFKTEVGDIVKLYKYIDAAFGNTINTGDANTDAAIDALIAALTAHGLIATS